MSDTFSVNGHEIDSGWWTELFSHLQARGYAPVINADGSVCAVSPDGTACSLEHLAKQGVPISHLIPGSTEPVTPKLLDAIDPTQELKEQVKVLTALLVALLEQNDGSFDVTRDEMIDAQTKGLSITELADLVRVQSDPTLDADEISYTRSAESTGSIIAEAVVAAQM